MSGEHRTATVTIEFRLGADPIAGSLLDADGEPHRFAGWLELTSLLRAAAGEPQRSGPHAGNDRSAEEAR